MVFSNDLVSPKQLYRLIIVATVGITSILHTDLCVRFAGGYGFFCMLFEFVLTIFYTCLILILCRKCEWNFVDFKHRFLPNRFKKIIYSVFMLKYLMLLVFTICFLVSLVRRELLAEMGYMGIIIPIILLMIYSVSKGVEARARLAETALYFIFVFIIILAFLGISNMKLSYVVMPKLGDVDGIFIGGLLLFFLFSPVEILLLMSNNFSIKKGGIMDKKIEKGYISAILWGIITNFVINIIYYIVCTGTLSTQVIMAKGNAVVSFAKNVKLPYMVFEKQEGIFMACFVISIFFTVFCLGHHTLILGEKIFGKINRISYLALALFTFLGCFLLINNTSIFNSIKGEKEKRVEIENRDYADSIYVEFQEGKYNIALIFPNESEVEKIMEFEVNEPKKILDEYERKSNKKLDLSHVQAVFINENILNDTARFQRFFYFLENDETYSDNMTICATSQNISDFSNNVEKLSPAPGKYISKMLENNLDINKTRYKDLKILMYDAKKYCELAKFNAFNKCMVYEKGIKISKKGYLET